MTVLLRVINLVPNINKTEYNIVNLFVFVAILDSTDSLLKLNNYRKNVHQQFTMMSP